MTIKVYVDLAHDLDRQRIRRFVDDAEHSPERASISRPRWTPAACAYTSAIGERQMFPVQTKRRRSVNTSRCITFSSVLPARRATG